MYDSGIEFGVGPRKAIVEWDEEFSVTMRCVSKTERRSIGAASDRLASRKHYKGSQAGEYSDKLYTAALVGWDGLKKKHYLEILEDVKTISNPEEEVPYSEEAKEWIIKHQNLSFINFLSAALEQAEQVGAEQLKN